MGLAFNQTLQVGRVGESLIATWLRSRGWNVLPVYDIEVQTGKGPSLFSAQCELIAPDMFVFNGLKVRWVEAKHKGAFSWHRTTQRWVTGIDLCHYEHYKQVAEVSNWPVYLMFLHWGGQAKDSPPNSPAGLFGHELKYLQEHENHRHPNWGNGGMVYWAHDTLRLLAPLKTLAAINRGRTKAS
jgi:hypothetical protein